MATMNVTEAAPGGARIGNMRSVGSEDRGRHTEGAKGAQKAQPLMGRSFVSYGDAMPTPPEAIPGMGQEIKGTGGDTEQLDPRAYPSSLV